MHRWIHHSIIHKSTQAANMAARDLINSHDKHQKRKPEGRQRVVESKAVPDPHLRQANPTGQCGDIVPLTATPPSPPGQPDWTVRQHLTANNNTTGPVYIIGPWQHPHLRQANPTGQSGDIIPLTATPLALYIL